VNVHCLQHEEFEEPAYIRDWLLRRGHRLVTTGLFREGASFPDPESFDLLLLMGGPMSVNDEAGYPWLAEEKLFIRRAVEGGKKVLGICLGAQLIACALGGRVYPNPMKEIGWYPVELTAAGKESRLFPRDRFTVLHWHGETFELPPGAALLAASAACPRQAFTAGSRVLGLQFHPEVKEETVRNFIASCGEELTEGEWIQQEKILTEKTREYAGEARRIMEHLLERFLKEDAS